MSRQRKLPAPLHEIPFVIQLAEWTPPFEWEEVFGRLGPVEIELGSGKGLFLAEAARLRPEANFLGVERAGKYFRHAVARIWKAELGNVRLLQADAFDLLARWVPAQSLSALHVYFPDPWPKKRHAKRRMLRQPLYDLAARVLRPEAPFQVASDVEPYFEEAVAEIEGCPAFRGVEWPDESPDRQPTSYALKYRQEGRSLNYAKFIRRVE